MHAAGARNSFLEKLDVTRMNIFQAKTIPLVIGAFTLTGCEAIVNTLEFLEIIAELYQSIRDYPRFWIAGLVIIAFYYIFYGRKHNRKF